MWIGPVDLTTLPWRSLPFGLALSVTVLCLVGALASAGTSVTVGAWRRLKRSQDTFLASRLAALCPKAFESTIVFFLLDTALLAALPLLRLSFAPSFWLPLLAVTGVRLVVLGALFWVRLAGQLSQRPGGLASARPVVGLLLAVNLLLSGLQVYGYVVEPLWVETTQLSLTFADLASDAPPLRIVHLTDTHVARSSYREATIVRRVNALQPDLIVLTGDYLNLSYFRDPVSAAQFQELIGQLHTRYGIFAVRGSIEPYVADMARLVEGTAITWLEQQAITLDVRGQAVTLVGVACSHDRERDGPRLAKALHGVPRDAFTLLLYHSPDLIAEASEAGIDLYLGGHTHGGQIRLPFYGAVFTSSIYHKRFEAGLYQVESTRMVISRGLGLEGGMAPRARFLCRPEIVSLDLSHPLSNA